MTDRLSQTLRSDAQDNRDRILAAARATFTDEGLDVPVREIARRAGVAPATLYRRFPTKHALVTEAFAAQMAACTGAVEEGLADEDPWRGFCRAVDKVCAIHAQDRGFTAAFVSTFPHGIDLAAAREPALRSLAELIRRAKETGKLRPDFVLDDLTLMLMANDGIRATTPAPAAAASRRRFVALMLQGFRAGRSTPPLPPAVRLPPTTVP